MKPANWFRCTTPTATASTSCIRASICTRSHRVTGSAARGALSCPPASDPRRFVGRIQPLKAPDVLLRAAAAAAGCSGRDRRRASGSGLAAPDSLVQAGRRPGHRRPGDVPAAAIRVRTWSNVYRAADLVAVPSYSESFGPGRRRGASLRHAGGGRVGGWLPVAVADGHSGTLVDGHDPRHWAAAIAALLDGDADALSRAAVDHAGRFSWGSHRRRVCWPAMAGRWPTTAGPISAAPSRDLSAPRKPAGAGR